MQKTERLVAITLLLQSRGKMTAERLASILDVSVRTIYRDMDALSLAHIPVSMDYGPGGGYFLPEDYRIDPATFTSEEALALALGGSMAGGYRLFESEDGLRRALFKLEAALPEEYRTDVQAARERILFDTTAWHKRPATPVHLETVRAAVWGSRQIDIFYPRSQGTGDQWRRAEPHGLVCKAGVWYLVAYCHIRKGFRTFRIDRIKEVTVREETVTPRPGFNLQEYWEESRRQFERQVNPFALTLSVSQSALRRIGSSGSIVRDGGDGWTVVCLELPSQEEAVSYALSLGADARVIAPPEVRAAVAQAVREMALQYA